MNNIFSKKIIFVTFVNKPAHFEKRFFTDDLSDNGLKIELWDLSAIFANDHEGDKFNPDFVKKIANRGEFFAKLKENRSANFVMLFDLEYRFLWIYRMLTKYRCKLFFFEWGQFPYLKKAAKSFSIPTFPTPGRLYRGAALRICKKLGLVKDFDVVLYAGSKAKEIHQHAHRYIPVNLPDFEEYCDLVSSEPALDMVATMDKAYLVFLDAYLPFHPDFRITGLENLDPEKYRVAINGFFDKIESELGVPVVIAAHPKSEYPPGYFGGRILIKNKTAELVMRSTAVITHYSTATSYAVLWKKPLVFIYSDDMESAKGATHMMTITAGMADVLVMPIVNIDHLPASLKLSRVRDDLYDDYRVKYITTNTSCESRNKDIFLSEFAMQQVVAGEHLY